MFKKTIAGNNKGSNNIFSHDFLTYFGCWAWSYKWERKNNFMYGLVSFIGDDSSIDWNTVSIWFKLTFRYVSIVKIICYFEFNNMHREERAESYVLGRLPGEGWPDKSGAIWFRAGRIVWSGNIGIFRTHLTPWGNGHEHDPISLEPDQLLIRRSE